MKIKPILRDILLVVVTGFVTVMLTWQPIHAQLQATSPQNGALFNQTAVSASGAVATDQNLQQIVEPAGNLNYIGKTARVRFSGEVTSGATGAGTWTIKLKQCTVSGCGSGTANTLLTWGPSAAQVASATNAPFSCEAYVITNATGSSGTVNSFGICHMETTSATLQTDSPTFPVSNTAASAAIDLTGQTFWQVTLADSGASANNVITGRYVVRVLEN